MAKENEESYVALAQEGNVEKPEPCMREEVVWDAGMWIKFAIYCCLFPYVEMAQVLGLDSCKPVAWLWQKPAVPLFYRRISAMPYVVVWLMGFALVLWGKMGWTYWECLYWSAQSGLSVGFGDLNVPSDHEDQLVVKLHTVFHVIAGAIFISVVFGMLVQFILERRTVVRSRDYWEVAAQSGNSRLREGQELMELIEEESFLTKMSAGWTKMSEGYRLLCLWGAWTSVGSLFGVCHQGWDFVTALYFSITAMSTGGLQGVNCDSTDSHGQCHIDAFPAMFTCIFVLVGVPIFGVTMGFAGDLVSKNFASSEASIYLGQPVLDPLEISPLCILKRELCLTKYVWRRLREDFPDTPLPHIVEDLVSKYADEYHAGFIQLTNWHDPEAATHMLAHDALDTLAQSRTRIFYKNWAIFGGKQITPSDVPFDVEGETMADLHHWEENKGSYRGLDVEGVPLQEFQGGVLSSGGDT